MVLPNAPSMQYDAGALNPETAMNNFEKISLASRRGAVALAAAIFSLGSTAYAAEDNGPLTLSRDGFFYVGGKTMTVGGRDYFYGQMYVEVRIPADQTRPY